MMRINREQKFLEIISSVLKDNSFIGDDCAYLKDFDLVITQDSLNEGVHFDLAAINPNQLGAKSVLVNISDVLASGAKPKFLTISISGNLSEDFIKQFYSGVNEICEEFNVQVVGGDLCSGQKIGISICAIGDCRGRKISSRKNAKEGYVVAVCGLFGASALGLEQLNSGNFDGEFVKYHIRPKLFSKTAEMIATKCKGDYALMDSSDGLYDCLYQISIRSGVKMDVEYKKIPRIINTDKTKEFKTTFFGGEDYCLLGCFSESDFTEIKKYNNDLVEIGRVFEGEGVFADGIEIKEDLRYVHFEN